MATISIGDNHKPHLARLQHICEHMLAERERLEAELRYVCAAGQRAQNEITAFVQQVYGVDAQHSQWTLDTDSGVIHTSEPQ